MWHFRPSVLGPRTSDGLERNRQARWRLFADRRIRSVFVRLYGGKVEDRLEVDGRTVGPGLVRLDVLLADGLRLPKFPAPTADC